MEIYRAKPATKQEMCQFHTDEYIDFISRVNPDNLDLFTKEQIKFNVGDDCPVFDGLFEYCGISGGGSMEGAARLNRGNVILLSIMLVDYIMLKIRSKWILLFK